MDAHKRCIHCKGLDVCRKDNRSLIFVIIGMTSTVAIRVVTVLMDVNPIYGKTAWYVGVIGFIIFFVYKYRVFKARADIIDKSRILEKIAQKKQLSPEDLEIISIILCKIKSNRERVNFLVIFLASIIALVLAVYFDFIHPI